MHVFMVTDRFLILWNDEGLVQTDLSVAVEFETFKTNYLYVGNQ